jgi:hypothetical protein
MSDDEPLVLPAGDWTVMPRPRVAPAARPSLGPVARALLWLTRRRTSERDDFTVLLTLARLGKLFPAHMIFLSQLLGKTRLTAVRKRDRRVAGRMVARMCLRIQSPPPHGHRIGGGRRPNRCGHDKQS